MTVAADDWCPRCGGLVETKGGAIFCLSVVCKAAWTDSRHFDREWTARNLASSAKRKVGPEYLAGGRAKEGTLEWELNELAALATYQAYEHVLKNVQTAIDGRVSAMSTTTTGKPDGWVDRVMQLEAEIRTLQSMRRWLERAMEGYAE